MISDDYVLYDDRGLKSDFYLHLLNDFEQIGVMLSGGPDSAFVFYWLSKCIHENKLNNTVLLMTGWEMGAKYQPKQEVFAQVEMINSWFPDNNVVGHYFWEYGEDTFQGVPKSTYEQHKEKFVDAGMIDVWINGVVHAPLFDDIDLGFITKERSDRSESIRKRRGPFQHVDKKFIAHQYNKYNLLENLFPLTSSCIYPDMDGKPCKHCDWCKERNWAFGTYK